MPFSTVCFRHNPAGVDDEAELRRRNEAILERVNATGRVFISHTQLGGRYALRVAIGNLATSAEHVDRRGTCCAGRRRADPPAVSPSQKRHETASAVFGDCPRFGGSVSSRKRSWREPATGIAISAPSTPRSSPPSSTATRIRNAESCTVRR